MKQKVLVLGSGGREHAFVWAFVKDICVGKIFCAPGNAGTDLICENINLNISNHSEIINFVKKENINLTVVGPEIPLAEGIVDTFRSHNLQIFGPDKFSSQLESSKIFARDIMKQYNIPQPIYSSCSSIDEAYKIKDKINLPLVLKVDGLAAGKGVFVCYTEKEFEDGLKEIFTKNVFGGAASKISIEECLDGEELSVFAVCDGYNYKILNSAQDHKRIYDNDIGPNTGGMGAYSPTPLSNIDIINKTCDKIITPILQSMRDLGHPYIGFLYVGLMIKNNEPYVIEFNVRMGDPEAQVVIPLLQMSLYKLLIAAVNKKLDQIEISISEKYAVCVVLASKGYPKSYKKGENIEGLELLQDKLVFHAGTRIENGKYVTNGGRVLNIIGFGESLAIAIEDVYNNVKKINFTSKYYRRDIGNKGLNYKRSSLDEN